MVFTKNPASACLSGEEIVIPNICQDREQVDFEGELAVVIGRPVKDATEDEARDPASGVVLGYCVANDVSARWWQKEGAGGQFCRGKSFDTFCPLSTPLASPADIDPSALIVTTVVSGETMQHAPTSAMTFTVPYLIAELSRGTTLLPGTVILTGTPSGVGMSREPQRFLREATPSASRSPNSARSRTQSRSDASPSQRRGEGISGSHFASGPRRQAGDETLPPL